MREPEAVAAMVRLHELGWGARRIARELGTSKNTVKRYLCQGGWVGTGVPGGSGCWAITGSPATA